MTTDQPQWMKNVAAAHAERRHPPKVAADQPAPDSSLEEARQSLVRCEACKGRGGFSDTSMGRGGFAGQMLTGCPACYGSGIDTRELEAFIKAAARAEVIREVEAALERVDAAPADPTYFRSRQDRRAFITDFMRALSQGGESDG